MGETSRHCGSDAFYHVLQFIPFAYILVWGIFVLYRRFPAKGRTENPPDAESMEASENPLTSTLTQYPEEPLLPNGGVEATESQTKDDATQQSCINGLAVFCIAAHAAEAGMSAASAALFWESHNDGLMLLSMCIASVMWLWGACVLFVSPADQHCSLPIWWTLMLNANIARSCQISEYGFGDPFGRLLFAKIAVNLILVLLTWRVFIGVLITPIIVAIIFVQVCIRGCQRLCRRCCTPADSLTETQEATQDMSLFCVSSEEHLLGANTQLANDETLVEVVIYELWPSSMPCYIGTWLGAYHTGVAADVNHSAGTLEYTFEVPDGIKARKRGKRPIYVQGLGKRFVTVGRCKKAEFLLAIQELREAQKFSAGDNYRILSNNCHTFCDELLESLGPGVPGRVPAFARFLDDLIGFFIPGGSLQGLEDALEVIGNEEDGGCDRRCLLWTLAGCVGCIISVSIPAILAVHASL